MHHCQPLVLIFQFFKFLNKKLRLPKFESWVRSCILFNKIDKLSLSRIHDVMTGIRNFPTKPLPHSLYLLILFGAKGAKAQHFHFVACAPST